MQELLIALSNFLGLQFAIEDSFKEKNGKKKDAYTPKLNESKTCRGESFFNGSGNNNQDQDPAPDAGSSSAAMLVG